MSGPTDQGSFEFAFDDADLDGVLSGAPEDATPVAPSDELVRLARRIAGQYVDVIAAFAAQAFAGRVGDAALEQVRHAIGALRRLLDAAHDQALVAGLDAFGEVVGRATAKGVRARQRYLPELRDAVVALSAKLDPEDGERLRNLVEWDRKALPLLDELSTLPGIGRRRLERLYCAGLFTIEAVGEADPEEIAQVTGLPRPLARQVVDATRRFAEEQRLRVANDLRDRARALGDALRDLPDDPATRRELVDAARTALVELQQALAALEGGKNA